MTGVQTCALPIFTVKAHLGWAYASYANGAGFNMPTVGAELGYRYSPMGRFVVLYDLNAYDSVNADFYRDHLLQGKVDQQFGQFLATFHADLRLRGYRGISAAIGAPSRDDVILSVGARANYVLKDTFAITADYHTDVDQSDYRYVVQNMNGPGLDDPSFIRHEVTVGIRAAF